MIDAWNPSSEGPEESAPIGAVLVRRMDGEATAIYVHSGRVRLGILGQNAESSRGALQHHLAVVEGPCWLDAPSAVLNMSSAFDAVAQTDVRLRRVPLTIIQAWLCDCSPEIRSLVIDLAQAKHGHDERAMKHLDKDALARLAELLMKQATVDQNGLHTVQLVRRRRDLAMELGMVPETLSRKLKQLRKLRLVTGTGRNLMLPYPGRLAVLSGRVSCCRRIVRVLG